MAEMADRPDSNGISPCVGSLLARGLQFGCPLKQSMYELLRVDHLIARSDYHPTPEDVAALRELVEGFLRVYRVTYDEATPSV